MGRRRQQQNLVEIKFTFKENEHLPIPLYVVVIDKIPHVAVSSDPYNWLINVNENWLICDKRYAPAIYTIKTYAELRQALNLFPDLKVDFYYTLARVIPIPLHISTITTETFEALLNQISKYFTSLSK